MQNGINQKQLSVDGLAAAATDWSIRCWPRLVATARSSIEVSLGFGFSTYANFGRSFMAARPRCFAAVVNFLQRHCLADLATQLAHLAGSVRCDCFFSSALTQRP
jgi:hypothetical protein